MYTVPELEYNYDALEPYISGAIMELHHDKHHKAYVDKLNAALESHEEWQETELKELLSRLDEVPEEIRTAVRNNGGGHYNHSLFWKVLSPNGGGQPGGVLGDDIVAKYGSFDAFVEQFNAAALGLFGSGWVWLTPELDIVTSPNQDSPLMHGQPEPLMGLDVWEHAYYLDYKNKRDDYVKAWWNVVDWAFVSSRYGR
ncbi:superoxide dismutase [Candidatus Saccharibacteria bacterium]|nr:superoxide dismutase [Candidatus Saccharibacteria bacterium]MBQ68726.1 superoxide dismutase [Candidatus Saccharibacteria bacterium]